MVTQYIFINETVKSARELGTKTILLLPKIIQDQIYIKLMKIYFQGNEFPMCCSFIPKSIILDGTHSGEYEPSTSWHTHTPFSPVLIYASEREVLENLRAVKTLAEEPAIPAQGMAAETCLGSPTAVYRMVTAFPTVKT